MKRATLVGALALFCAVAGAQEAALQLLGLTPEGADVVIGVDVKGLAASDAFQRLHEALDTADLDRGIQFIELLTDVNVLEDVDAVMFIGQLRENGKGGVIIRGDFEPKRLVKVVSLNKTYEEIDFTGKAIHTWNDEKTGKPSYATFLRDDVLVLSDRPEVLKSVMDAARAGGPAREKALEGLRATELPGLTAFMLARRPEGIEPDPKQKLLYDNVKAIVGGVHVGERNVSISLIVEAESPERAALLQDVFSGLTALVKLQDNELSRLPWTFEVTGEESYVRLRGAVPTSDVVRQAIAHAGK